MKILPSVLLVVAAAHAGAALAPRRKTRRTVLFAISLATLLACILPILPALKEIPALPETLFSEKNVPAADSSACVTGAAERALAEEMERRFGVAPLSVGIRVPLGEGDPGSILVTLAPRDALHKEKIALWLSAESKAAVTVLTEGETAE